jgi:hypothetical protein
MRTVPAFLLAAALWPSSLDAAERPGAAAEKALIEGKLAEGEKALTEILTVTSNDAEARFGLGAIQFLRAVERLCQSFHRYGLRHGVAGNGLPFVRLPIPPNNHPQPISYTDLEAIFQSWNDDLGRAEATLARIGENEKDVKLPLHFGQIRLDLDGNGKAEEDETLWKLYAQLNAPARNQVTAEASRDFVVAFDRGDVAWLRGYCNLLMFFGDVYLAYDSRELFDKTASLVFPEAETSFPFLHRQPQAAQNPDRFDTENILDAVAFIHLTRLPLRAAGRMQSALAHLEAMVERSHESWKFILAETDDDHEWVPKPGQHSVMPGGNMTMEMVKGWFEFLDEAKAILKGERLIPFWRHGDDRGVNLRRVFTEPQTFDLVLWFQGTAAVPYLEKGPLTRPEVWTRLQNIFRGEFIGFALWFN